ncbi:nucleoside 2-deoxyribosyltransferase [Phenylobacterium aquaticum]|uniref:nucleoside 2-deoxyribosyltransferase n=1 Tax=Phenylobacterium aquaticum TaxID=1763816 RepID=UPI001F5CA655|nr:nucleoside 2-deoxyribosyltransferase [Phenylobacterium aquaticum]MCI3132306.1 nucleoside 2-deoxyribosyltransferase [Phenylobacterium aquaticum]
MLLDEAAGPWIGCASHQALTRLIVAAQDKGLVSPAGTDSRTRAHGGIVTSTSYDLTLDGWDRYEAEQKGLTRGSYGFMAMKFGDPSLDELSRSVIKPRVRTDLGYDLVDLRDVARAGIIDNIMRAQIRDAAFVIVDLTHDNSGAYWEAGYAEGLGKPVIYICERNKFDLAKTHFDTNHCTTVIWDLEDDLAFADGLIATIRRSLNLFANSNPK